MAQRTTQEQRLFERATTVAQCNIEKLAHPDKAGSFDFESERSLLETIKRFYSDLISTSFASVPEYFLGHLADKAEQMIAMFSQLQEFNYTNGDPNQNRTGLVNQLRNRWRESYEVTVAHLALARISSSAILEEIRVARETAATITKEWKTVSDDYGTKIKASEETLKARLDELEKVIAAAREASKMQAVSAQAGEFEAEAVAALGASRWWLGGTIAAVLLSLGIVWFMFLKDLNNPPPANVALAIPRPSVSVSNVPTAPPGGAPAPAGESFLDSKAITAAVLQQTVARVLIVTVLYSVVVWCARNYFACRHNYTVNRHRRNAMQTFRAFVAGTSDPVTQDFILKQAATCAFAPQQSGYLKDESLPTPGPVSQFIESAKPETK